ncbi:hypothetical protein RSAG8_09236, partial [Rhizoctonia solani AG-8 WAC10335]
MRLRCTHRFRRGITSRPRIVLTRSLETCAVYRSFEDAAIAAANFDPTGTTLVVDMTQYKSIRGPKTGQVVGVGVTNAPPERADFLRVDYDEPEWRPDSKDPEEYRKQVRKFAELMEKLEENGEAPLGIHFNAHYVENGAVVQDKAFAAYIDMGTKKKWELQSDYDGYLKRLLYKPAVTIWDRWRKGEQPQ